MKITLAFLATALSAAAMFPHDGGTTPPDDGLLAPDPPAITPAQVPARFRLRAERLGYDWREVLTRLEYYE